MGEGQGGGGTAGISVTFGIPLPLAPSHQGRGEINLSKVDNQVKKLKLW